MLEVQGLGHLQHELVDVIPGAHVAGLLLTPHEVAVAVGLEQLYPFPADALAKQLEPYRHCHLVWCQEEPRNMGAWDHVDEFVLEVAEALNFEHPELRYAGRLSAASPATGLARVHGEEQTRLVADALEIGTPPLRRIAARIAAQELRRKR